MIMDTFACFPHNLRWTAQQLADAVPLRLHELYAITVDGPGHPAANGAGVPRRPRPPYVGRSPLPPRFRVG